MKMKKVLFVCIENSCRSQMAEGFAHHHGNGLIKAASAGTSPAPEIDKGAIQVMLEKNIDIGGQVPKLLTAEDIEEYDLIVTMGCGVEALCPAIPSAKKRDWDLEDPKGKHLTVYRRTRDQIEDKVKKLIAES